MPSSSRRLACPLLVHLLWLVLILLSLTPSNRGVRVRRGATILWLVLLRPTTETNGPGVMTSTAPGPMRTMLDLTKVVATTEVLDLDLSVQRCYPWVSLLTFSMQIQVLSHDPLTTSLLHITTRQ